jgi:predicted dienelactone hydrolase
MKSQLPGFTAFPASCQHSLSSAAILHKPTKYWQQQVLGLATAIFALGCAFKDPVAAAERLTLRLGPIERSVQVDDLAEFAETGDIPASLRFYKPLLTDKVREVLNQHLQIDPNVGDKFLDELLASPDGEQLIAQLRIAFPEVSAQQLRAALYIALHQGNGLSVISLLRAFPGENLTVDATAAASLALQLNAGYLQSRVLGPILQDELEAMPETAFLPEFDPGLAGEEEVRRRTFILRDRDRRRTIPVDFYYSDNSQSPLVVMSHGFAADRRFLTYLAEHLASHGYSVASLEHPGSNIHSLAEVSMSFKPSDLISANEFVDRPEDIRFLLDELERLGRDRDFFKDKFNTQEVTVIGHSLGGYTALALAGGELNLPALRQFCTALNPLGRSPADWLQCAAANLPESRLQLRDKRVVQAIALNPLVGKLFGDDGLGKIEIPVAILSGSDDAITPALDHQLRPFRQLQGEKYFLSAIGATHLSITDYGNLSEDLAQSTLVKERTGAETEGVRHWLRGFSLALIAQGTPAAQRYQPFLSPAYAQFLSPPANAVGNPVRLRFTEELPASTDVWLKVMSAGTQKIAFRPSPKKPSLLLAVDRCLDSARRILAQSEFCRGQLNQIFTSLLDNNDDWS